jgi:hypothetical protein
MAETPNLKTPTISRRLDDGRMIELIYDAGAGNTAFAVGKSGTATIIVPHLDLPSGERLVPYAAQNNLIATRCVLLPSKPEPFGSKAALIDAIRSYLHRYVDLSPTFAEIAAYYALYSWVYDAFNEAPYLRFRGDYGTGKTRALLTLGSICYKPFFASGASTVSPIFHVLDAFQGTLVLDEADFRFSDATASLTKILNNGNMAGLPVLRTMTNRNKEFDPRAFRVFGPKLVGMRQRFTDEALESRFLTEDTGLRAVRPDIPIQTPADLAKDALHLRNKLLAWRFASLDEVAIDATRAAPGVEPRFNQTALPLLSIIDEEAIRQRIHERLREEDRRVHLDRASSVEAIVVRVLHRLFEAPCAAPVTVSDITDQLNRLDDLPVRKPVTPKWVGWVLRTRLRLTTVKTRGVFTVPESEKHKVAVLSERFGIIERSGSP